MIVFSHLTKNGGTTIVNILRNNFLTKYTLLAGFNIKNNVLKQNQLNKVNCYHPKSKAISGHSIKPYIDLSWDKNHENNNSIKIIFLRDPISRFVSSYNHFYNHTKKISFQKYIELYASNFQTNWISNTSSSKSDKNFKKSKKYFVGIVEMFDESLVLLRERYFQKFNYELNICYEKSNMQKIYALRKNDISLKHKRILRNKLKEDFILYERAIEEIYNIQKNSYKGNLDDDILGFKKQNQNFRFSNNILIMKIFQRYKRLIFNLNTFCV